MNIRLNIYVLHFHFAPFYMLHFIFYSPFVSFLINFNIAIAFEDDYQKIMSQKRSTFALGVEKLPGSTIMYSIKLSQFPDQL